MRLAILAGGGAGKAVWMVLLLLGSAASLVGIQRATWGERQATPHRAVSQDREEADQAGRRGLSQAPLPSADSSQAAGEMARPESIRAILARLAPKTPEASLDCFQVRAGFRIELMCAEPMVSDPIAIDWGADGTLWVVEMGDYPNGGASAPHQGGRIRCLADRDQDGQFDYSRVFLDGLEFPTGVMPWRDGVLVACAPDIFFARDTDGDGRADERQVLFTGFIKENPLHQVNSLRLGLDNWVYASNGDNGGVVSSRKTGDFVDIHGRDCRIKPDLGWVQTATGMSQYGRCRDQWGNWFGGRNLTPIWHCVLPDHYLRRNPLFAPPDPCVDLMDPPACAPVFPISQAVPRFNELWTFNRFTAACGIEIYRDNLFGDEFAHSCFICEPAYNLVHHGKLSRDGVTFLSRRASEEQQSEFLASRDSWFRPTQVRTGPDGALWVVDMYRLVIEHPDYIPDELHDQLDFHAGAGMGRIYRIVPTGESGRTALPIEHLRGGQLVAVLDSPNGPTRDLARRLLIRRKNSATLGPLKRMATAGRLAASRVSALATLDGMGAADIDTLLVTLEDAHPAVRRHAIRLSESRLQDSPALQRAVVRLHKDPDPQVRLQLAFSLGEWPDPRAGKALAEIAVHDAEDHFIMAAVMSSAVGHPGEILRNLVRSDPPSAAQTRLMENLIRLLFDAERAQELAIGIQRVCATTNGLYEAWQFRVLATLLDDLAYRGSSLTELYADAGPNLRSAILATNPAFRAASQVALDDTLPVSQRSQAVRLMGRGLLQRDVEPSLAELLRPQSPLELQQSVVDALATLAPEKLPELLLERWEQHGPQLRRQILATLLSRKGWTLSLVAAVEQDRVRPSEIAATQRNALILHSSASVRRRASRLLRTSTTDQLPEVIRRYRASLNEHGDQERGRQLFVEHCSACHQIAGQGTEVGADILSLTDRSSEALLNAILDPNQAVAPRYAEYTVMTVDGRVLSGIIARETGNSITLLDAQAKKHVLLRRDVDELISTGQSLMPVGMEEMFRQPEDLNDLITYIRSLFSEPPESAEVR